MPDIEHGTLVSLHPMTVPSKKGKFLVFPEIEFPDPRLKAFADWLRADVVGKSK